MSIGDNGLSLTELLEKVRSGELAPAEAKKQLEHSAAAAYGLLGESAELGFATLDLSREKRTGFPEVIYGEGKTAEHILAIFRRFAESADRVLATRVSPEKAALVTAAVPGSVYHETARAITWFRKPTSTDGGHYVAVVCAGTSDLPVAEEAAVTLEAMGCRAERIYDVGVAGIHRLFAKLEPIRQASVVIVVAGMEGALASVIGGLISRPLIAVPTSIGYGASFNGLSALLTMLNSCAPGVNVVNIDNGFGAAYSAAVILKTIEKR
ncbi:nickel pincer cofactor biosynthesis protein LarB [Paenibacillus turpanensis]|uniref:nickel pincer cofactor biosynthesis protein LarB n=1 Tax=Paenibacillus turpanensis TaxID=2689078 RepID=UPI00140C5AFD|nr:nickel pincer cofactor biosynthesis protein LarB [Paenibacillus turpanensis]